jgi:hypothetical protein
MSPRGPTRYNDDFPSISPSQKRQKAKLTGVLAAIVERPRQLCRQLRNLPRL